MKDYLWVFILAIISLLAAGIFLGTITQSSMLVNKLKLPKLSLALNFVLLFISLVNIGLIAYVILLVREQIILLT
jgi:hypothetical protein